MNRLKDRVGIVTGGGKGLGRATALMFAEEGAKVVVADIDLEGANETVEAIRARGGDAIAVATDVRKAADAENLARAAVERYGRIDVLVNNAGVRGKGTVLELTEEQWDTIIDVNLKGMFLCSKYVLPVMQRQQAGNIVCVSSMAGVVGHAGQAAYNASKHGVIGLARCMAMDYAADGIRVNVVCPGIIDTGMLGDETPETLRYRLSGNLMKRAAQPEEIARTVLHLASDESSYSTGAVFNVDAGGTTSSGRTG